ncbi:hypothetical protein P5V93_13005 [Mycobacteroides abscessus subsp. abscessus]|nr:hypothetical protein [Mycobacteroides abscessus]MDO3100828.1 hypothetical protein [Mycobacteroides abscessus subsp. abscessus]MDO3230190.1 hypothetical protein [Mycobacteroides abscessus subsp. abscessus]MDO3285436.1 hypothetical protein [Mycobacteroides abscessus subsp. abscessus]MDO3369468.1 hypothetical protein [Mycobacteroides abscessus subsp. abscessus]SHV29366.1 Uncharacterised protein [Mycobacteroides abscessus subsp. abscessus]
MTDARFPDRWLHDRRMNRLSDGHFRSYVLSLIYAVSNRTDGVVEPEDLATIPKFAPGASKAFVENELWRPRGNGWLIIDFESTQSSRAALEASEQARNQARINDRERKAKARAEAKARSQDKAKPDSPQDVRSDVRGEVQAESEPESQARKGQARRGKDKGDHQNVLPLAAGDEWHGTGDNPYVEYK